MKKVYFVQANMQYGKALYLPYATGCLAAYAWQFEETRREYEIGDFLFKREPVESIITHFDDADVVAFSCYNWTFEYNKALAKAIKSHNPDCVIIFGGHNVSDNNDILNDYDFVDYLIYGEGEPAFKGLLDALAGRISFEKVPSIAFRNGKKVIKTKRAPYGDLETYVSPYLEGYFDSITAQNPDTEFCAVVETNRGCPYQCAYCDWCYSPKLRKFSIERVKADIEWCAKHKVEYIFCADSNFGIFDRDLEIAQYVVQLKKDFGYPHIFNTCFAKNSNQTVFEISKLFYDNRLNKAATLAYQTVEPTALANVNRKNFTVEAFADLVKKYNDANIPTYTEMILGLPGETYESFCRGICSLIEAGQQSALTVYYCQVYTNSLMGSAEYRKKFGIQTAHVPINYLHSSIPRQSDITEYTDLIVSTDSMPFEDMLRSIMFCTCLQCFHHIGLLKYFAIYLNYEQHIPYLEFYNRLLDYIFSAKGTFVNAVFERVHLQCSTFSNGEWSYYDERFGEIGWFLEEGIFMELIGEFDTLWKDILPFLKEFKIDKEVFDELLKFQKFVIRLPGQDVVSESFVYDFLNYFHNIISANRAKLKKKKNKVEVTIYHPVYNWKDYARFVMLYLKRRGGTVIINDYKNVKQTYLE